MKTFKEYLQEKKHKITDIESIEVDMAEGKQSDTKKLDNKTFKTIKDIEKVLANYEKPLRGYNKVFTFIKFKDGETIRFRYDHSENDEDFETQLKAQL